MSNKKDCYVQIYFPAESKPIVMEMVKAISKEKKISMNKVMQTSLVEKLHEDLNLIVDNRKAKQK